MWLLSDEAWIKFFINPLWLILIMCGLVLTEYLIFSRLNIRQDDRRLGITIYAITFLGILGLVIDNRNYAYEVECRIVQERLAIDFQREFINQLDTIEYDSSIPFVKTEQNSSYYDDLLQNQRKYNMWLCKQNKYLKRQIRNYELINADSLKFSEITYNPVALSTELKYIKDSIATYNAYVNKLNELKQYTYRDREFRSIYSFCYPLLLVIGLSLQFAKEFFIKKT